MRTDRERPHAGRLMREIVPGRGAAGGHGQIAGGRLHAPITGADALAAVYADGVVTLTSKLGIFAQPTPLVA